MKGLFSDGNGSVYKTCVSWLSSGDEHLQISGCLAIGNFGRTGKGGWAGLGWAEDQIVIFNCDLNLYKFHPTDENCIKLVEQGVHEKLLNLLARSSHREVIFTE